MLDHVAVVADVEHRHCSLVGPGEGFLTLVATPCVQLPASVLELELLRHASQVPVADRRDTSANSKPTAWKWVGHPEHHAALQRSTERARSAWGEFEPHRGGRHLKIQLVAVRFDFETRRQSAQQPGCCRAEHAEPEDLDVSRPRVVASFVDNRVDPLSDRQERGGLKCVAPGGVDLAECLSMFSARRCARNEGTWRGRWGWWGRRGRRGRPRRGRRPQGGRRRGKGVKRHEDLRTMATDEKSRRSRHHDSGQPSHRTGIERAVGSARRNAVMLRTPRVGRHLTAGLAVVAVEAAVALVLG
jgi:hypothetical protein